VGLDGTKVAAHAAADRTHAQLEKQVAELLEQAAEIDRIEDAKHGPGARGDELPRGLAARAERLARLQRATAQLEAEARSRGQQPIAHSRPRRRDEAPRPAATVNTIDPDSRFVRRNGRTLQGYNAQAAATTDQIGVAAELTQQANDVQQLAPMLTAIGTLTRAGMAEPLQRVAADPGYWSIANVSAIPDAPELLIPPAHHGRHGKPRKDGEPSASKSDGLRAMMRKWPGVIWQLPGPDRMDREWRAERRPVPRRRADGR
jgi:hypothetical protein